MIEFDNAYHGREIMKAMGAGFSPDVMTVIGRVAQDEVIGDELLGGVVYEDYTGKGGSVNMHFAGFYPRWINRDMLWVCFHYPFMQLECRAVFGKAKANNTLSRQVIEGLGYKQVAVIEDVYPECELIVYRMRKDECRFLSLKPKTLAYGRNNLNG